MFQQIFHHHNISLGHSIVEDRSSVPFFSVVDVSSIVDEQVENLTSFGSWLADTGRAAGHRHWFAHLLRAVLVCEVYTSPPTSLQRFCCLDFYHFESCLEILRSNHYRLATAGQLSGTLHRIEDGHSTADCFVKIGDGMEGVSSLMVGYKSKPGMRIWR